LIILFIIQDFWSTCACPEKQSCPEIFHCIEIFFIFQDFWATCACPENRVYPENFQAGGAAAPLPPLRTPMVMPFTHVEDKRANLSIVVWSTFVQ